MFRMMDGKLIELTQEEKSARNAEELDFNQKMPNRRLKNLRRKRDKMLKDSDWTQLNDAVMSADKMDEWIAYRQKLRDLPALYPNAYDVVFPQKP